MMSLNEMELLTLLKAVFSLSGILFIGCNISSLINVNKTIDEERKLLVKDLHEFVKSFVTSFFGFGVKEDSSNITWPAVKFVRDPPHHKYIVIREKELKELKELFDELPNHDNEVNVVYLLGVPGSGKTEIARQYGNFAYEKHGVSTVITLSAEKVEDFRQDLVEALIEIQKSQLTMEQIDSMGRWSNDPQISTRFLMNIKLRPLLQERIGWLLIIDNIRDPNITQNELYKELPWPGTDKWGTGKMLVTTQVPLHNEDSAHVRIKNTNDGLTLDDATKFLCGLVTRNERRSRLSRVCNVKVAQNIVTVLERLPLSIFAAGIHIKTSMSIKNSGWYSLEDYLAELASLGISHAHDLKPSQSGYPRSMLAALQLTIEETIKVNSDELPSDVFLDFIGLIGFTAVGGTISSSHVENYITMRGHDQNRGFLTLINFPLVDFWEEEKRFRTHQVVKYAFRAALERRGADLLVYTFRNISHYFAIAHKSNPDDWKTVHIFINFIQNLPSQYCNLNCCITSPEGNFEDASSLVYESFQFVHVSACSVLDKFLVQLCNIRRGNVDHVPSHIIFPGYQLLHSCYKEKYEKQMVVTRAIDLIKEIAPEHSELHTVLVSKFLLYKRNVLPWLEDGVFRFFLCWNNISDSMYFKVHDVRQVVDSFKKLCSSLSEVYKILIDPRDHPYSFQETREVLIRISKMASIEVHLKFVSTMLWYFISDPDSKPILRKELLDEYYIGLGRNYRSRQYKNQKDVYLGKSYYSACLSKQVYTVMNFRPCSLIFYIDYDIRCGVKNAEIAFYKYFGVIHYLKIMLREFDTILQDRELVEQKNRDWTKFTRNCRLIRVRIKTEIQGQQSFLRNLKENVTIESSFQDQILLFLNNFLCSFLYNEYIRHSYEKDVQMYKLTLNENKKTIDNVHWYLYIDAMASTIKELPLDQRSGEITEILLEIFDAVLYALWQ